MRIRLTLRRDPAESKDLAVTVDGLATVADTAAVLWAADPGRKGTPAPDNLSLRIEEALGDRARFAGRAVLAGRTTQVA